MQEHEVRRQCADRFTAYLCSELYDHTPEEFERMSESLLGAMTDLDPVEEHLKLVAKGLVRQESPWVIFEELKAVRESARREERESLVKRLSARVMRSAKPSGARFNGGL